MSKPSTYSLTETITIPASEFGKFVDKVNRINATTLDTKRTFWCACDMNKIHKYGRCQVCGRSANRKRKKY